MAKKQNKKILILEVIGILLTIYFLYLEPELKYYPPFYYNDNHEFFEETFGLRYNSKINLKNSSLKKGNIQSIKINPKNIPYSNFKIHDIDFDREEISFFSDKSIIYTFTYTSSKFFEDNNNGALFIDTLRVTFYDNLGYSIIDENTNEVLSMMVIADLTPQKIVNNSTKIFIE